MNKSTSQNFNSADFPTQAQVVIIGGGIIGTSIAYHLAKLGWQDVVLLERKQLTAGTTWHAAGLIATAGFASETSIEMAKYTRDLYQTLEAETGQATGFVPIGLLQTATNKEELEFKRRGQDYARRYGIEIAEISPAEVKKMWPLLRTDAHLLSRLGSWLPQCTGLRQDPAEKTGTTQHTTHNTQLRSVPGTAVT